MCRLVFKGYSDVGIKIGYLLKNQAEPNVNNLCERLDHNYGLREKASREQVIKNMR